MWSDENTGMVTGPQAASCSTPRLIHRRSGRNVPGEVVRCYNSAVLSFPFDIDKLIQALTLLSRRGVGELTRLKAAKLLYFADKEHLLRHGRPILGDEYFALEMGPIPSRALDFMEEAAEKIDLPDRERLREYLSIEGSDHPEFVATREPDLDVLSKSEIEILEQIVARYGKCSTSQLVSLTHEEPAWKIAEISRPAYGRKRIPYEDFFEGSGREEILKLALAEQDDRDFVAALRR